MNMDGITYEWKAVGRRRRVTINTTDCSVYSGSRSTAARRVDAVVVTCANKATLKPEEKNECYDATYSGELY